MTFTPIHTPMTSCDTTKEQLAFNALPKEYIDVDWKNHGERNSEPQPPSVTVMVMVMV